MRTSSARSESPQTVLRKLRTFLDEAMAEAGRTPPICARIRATRDALKDAQTTTERRSFFSQEKVAQRVGVSLKAYRAWEKDREPNYERRRAIARALELDEDYFEQPAPDLVGLEARYSELVELFRSVDGRLGRLERQEPPTSHRS